MRFRVQLAALLASTALSGAAFAQTAPTPAPSPTPIAKVAAKPKPKATPAPAATPTPAPVAAAAPKPERRNLTEPGLTASPTDFGFVYASGGQGAGANPSGVTRQDLGGGFMIEEDATKSRSTVTRDAIDKQAPSANPYQLVNLLPGVIQTSSDNIGLNGGNLRIRGFNSDHLGLTIEGMPVNDSGNYALYPQEYVDGENISQISIAQGAPDLDSPHIGAAGGVMNIYMLDPSKTFGGLVDISVGSHAEYREFARVDSGQVGNVRALFSYSHLQDDHWAGPGKDLRDNVEFKSVWDPAPGATVRLSLLYNHADNNFYANPTMAQFNTPGYSPNYLGQLPATFFNAVSPIDQSAGGASNYYKYKVNPFNNLIASAPSNFSINSNLSYDVIPYFWYGFGNGGGVTTMSDAGMYWGNLKITNVNYGGTAALTDKTFFYNPSITETYRPGIVNKLTYTLGDHKLVGGWWFEDAFHKQTGPFEQLSADGSVPNEFANGTNFSLPAGAVCTINVTGTNGTKGTVVGCPTGPMEKRDQLTHTITNMIFAGDTWTINDKWTADFGLKQIFVNRTVSDNMPGAIPSGSLNDVATLPTFGLRFKPNEQNQIWGSIQTTFRSAPNYTLAQSFSSTTGVIAPIDVPPPERGAMFEIGHRYQSDMFATSVSAFYGKFQNYQLSTNIADPAGSGSNFGVTLNAGGLTVYGIDAEVGTRPFYNFRPYVSGELLHTSIDSNFPTTSKVGAVLQNDYLPTQGKQLPGSPNFSAGIGLDYDDGHFFGNVAYKYQGPQYSTFMNDEQMPGFGRVDAALGYRFANIAGLKAPEIKLSLSNLANARQLTGVSSITTNAVATTGTAGGTVSASAPSYYMGEGFTAVLSFKTAF